MEKKLKKVGDKYETTTISTEEEIVMKRARLIKNVRDLKVMLNMRKGLLSEINIALGREAEDETEIR